MYIFVSIMNIKLNNDETPSSDQMDAVPYTSAEERRRTGRIIAIIVGISLVCLAMYHAWVRNVPVLASLLVPALIMLLYIAWVLYTASKDKRKELEMEAGIDNLQLQAVVIPEPPPSQPQPLPQPQPQQSETKEVTATKKTKKPTSPKRVRRCYSIA